MTEEGKLIIVSAPSGSGKSTIIRYLLSLDLPIAFSVSATSRPPRGQERDGVEYYFLSPETFREKITAGEFIEYEEVYEGAYYGTLRSEIERIFKTGRHVIFDIDVVGGCNLKQQFGDRALSIFIQPPSIDELRHRLEIRHTDSPAIIAKRIEKASFEMGFASRFDVVVVNDDLERAKSEALNVIKQFLKL
ncbi:MAG: guanylate kinase [Tannerella sp.]|jgi:guanylate kinase|nr:guanylate kinase [Tannerella sp.]